MGILIKDFLLYDIQFEPCKALFEYLQMFPTTCRSAAEKADSDQLALRTADKLIRVSTEYYIVTAHHISIHEEYCTARGFLYKDLFIFEHKIAPSTVIRYQLQLLKDSTFNIYRIALSTVVG